MADRSSPPTTLNTPRTTVVTGAGGWLGSALVHRLSADPTRHRLRLATIELEGRMRMQDVDPNHPGLFNIQDIVAMSGQGKIYDRKNERLGQSDIGIILLRKIYQRELGKIRAGRPIKKWQRTADKVMLGFKPLAAE